MCHNIKPKFRVLATICKRSHVDKRNGEPAGYLQIHSVVKKKQKTCIIDVTQ